MTESINLLNWPSYLAAQLGIPVFAAGILASLLVTMLFIMPIMAFDRGKHPLMYVLIGMPLLGFTVAVTWLPIWIFLILCLVVALLFAKEIKGAITGPST